MRETWVQSLGWEDPLEKGKATHSSILGLPWWLSCNVGDLGSIPGLGRSPGEGKSYPPQYSGLENSMDCVVHGVAKSRTQLSNFHFHPNIWQTYQNLHGDVPDGPLPKTALPVHAAWVQSLVRELDPTCYK